MVFASSVIPSQTTYTAPITTNEQKPPQIAFKSEPEAYKEPLECSCVNYAHSLQPDIPQIDAIDYPVNTLEPKVGDIIKLQYYNATTTRYTYHIAYIEEITEEGYKIKESNYEKCKTGVRTIKKTDDNIVGFFDVELWRKISKLTKEQKAVLQCESNFSHYKQNQIKLGKQGEIGIAQFFKETWQFAESLRKKNHEKRTLLDIYNPYDQIDNFVYLWDKGYSHYWHAKDSDCYKKLMGVSSP